MARRAHNKPKCKAIILARLREGNTFQESCWGAEMHTNTAQRWRREDPAFDKAVYRAIMAFKDQHLAFMKDEAYNKRHKYAVNWLSHRVKNYPEGPDKDQAVDNWFAEQEKTENAEENS